MDGIESREGIYVVAASSRPDLIDPAILRPGRLDKVILCNFPEENERFEILRMYYTKAHTEGIFMADGIIKALKVIAKSTEYYTGADLQSIIYNAYLRSVKRNIANNNDETPMIFENDLFEAFKGFKKSLNEKDITFQKEIKKKFIDKIENTIDRERRNSKRVDLKTTLI